MPTATTSRWILLGVLNAPVYVLLGKLLFGGFDGFIECVKFWLTPDLFSMFRGEYWEDQWSELKLWVFVALCGLILWGEYRFFFGDPFKPSAAQLHAQKQSITIARLVASDPNA